MEPMKSYCWQFDPLGWPCLTQTEWASWVQAIGSIAALLIAIGIPLFQRWLAAKDEAKKERRLTREKCFRIRRANAIFQRRLGENLNIAEHFHNGLGDGRPAYDRTMPHEFESILHEVEGIPVAGAQALEAVHFAEGADEQVVDGWLDEPLRSAYRRFVRRAYDVSEQLDETLERLIAGNPL